MAWGSVTPSFIIDKILNPLKRDANERTFSSGNLGSVSRNKMVHCLSRRQFGYGGEDAKGITREENDVFGVAAHAGEFRVGDKVNWVSTTCVLRLGGVGVVNDTRV